MADRYQQLVSSGVGARLAGQLGLPRPAVLRRYDGSVLDGPVLLGRVGGGLPALAAVLGTIGAQVHETDDGETRYAAVVFDATGAAAISDLTVLRDVVGPALRRLRPSGRVVVLGRPAEGAEPAVAAVRQALDGLTRSLAKELRAGATGNLVVVGQDVADDAVESTLRFLLSGRSAYVDGQPILLAAGPAAAPADWEHPLAGKVAVVTGAARGIGAAIAGVLARDGARVICADLPAAGEALSKTANKLGGTALQLDIAGPEAASRLLDYARDRFDGLDIVVHNAGITRDRLLANMKPEQWDSVLAVNLQAQLTVNAALLASDVFRPSGRVVTLSSTSGIAGNRGQTNYAASKAGVIGMVRASASRFAERNATINAIAPGFIETDMTARMPFATREVARRLNSLQQAGQPVDVAEAVAWLASPGAGAVNGQVLRVCGQNLVGA
jgi:3-oxoacyl-[acyl-carrier protein] reductase